MNSFEYGSPEMWEYIDPKYVAIVKSHYGFDLYTESPRLTKNEGFLYGKGKVEINGINFTNVPENYRESLRIRPVEIKVGMHVHGHSLDHFFSGIVAKIDGSCVYLSRLSNDYVLISDCIPGFPTQYFNEDGTPK